MNRGLGVPGKSATERALQSRQRAERLLQQADQWDRGAHGERAVANLLSGLPAGCRVLHDLSIPGSAANIDHVVVATTGIFVIDTKNYRCTLTAGDGTLWRGRYPIRKECSGVAWQASKIGELVGHPARPVLCFVETKLPEPVQQLGPVIVCTDTAHQDTGAFRNGDRRRSGLRSVEPSRALPRWTTAQIGLGEE